MIYLSPKLYFIEFIMKRSYKENGPTPKRPLLPTPKVCDLSHRPISDDELEMHYIPSLIHNSELITLILDNTALTDQGAIRVANSLRHFPNLNFLSLTNNLISDDGMIAVVASLAHYTNLLTFCITGNPITAQTAKVIAEKLIGAKNCSLAELAFDVNDMSAEDVKEIATALKKNTTLQLLHIGLPEHLDTSKIIESAQEISSLLILEGFAGCEAFTQAKAEKIATSLKSILHQESHPCLSKSMLTIEEMKPLYFNDFTPKIMEVFSTLIIKASGSYSASALKRGMAAIKQFFDTPSSVAPTPLPAIVAPSPAFLIHSEETTKLLPPPSFTEYSDSADLCSSLSREGNSSPTEELIAIATEPPPITSLDHA
jgi:hypothetical protein